MGREGVVMVRLWVGTVAYTDLTRQTKGRVAVWGVAVYGIDRA